MTPNGDVIDKKYEPVLVNGEPKWLVITKSKLFPIYEGRTAIEITENPLPPEIETSFSIEEPDVWICKKCFGRFKHESENEPIHCPECNRDNMPFQRITESINEHLWKLPRWNDAPFDPSEMMLVFTDIINLLKTVIVFSEDILYKILALWTIASYKVECWNSVGFLVFTGEIGTGKSRSLEILNELGNRMMLCSGITFPAMIRASHYHHAGILMDEAHHKLDNKTEIGRQYIDFIKPSYRRGSHYTVADKEDQKKLLTYNNFGFKAFAGEKSILDYGFFSRSISFLMEQSTPEMKKLSMAQDDLDRIQTTLLKYRYLTENPVDISNDVSLTGRTWEIFESIITTGNHIGIEIDDIVEYAKSSESDKEEALQDSYEHDVLKAIKELSCQETLDDAPEEIKYMDILQLMFGGNLTDDDRRRQGGRLGYCIKNDLKLKHKRKKEGNVVLLNDEKTTRRLSYLYGRYKV